MCFGNNQPRPPEIRPVTPPPPPKPLQIAQQSQLSPRQEKQQERKKVKFGARSSRDPRNVNKRDASSLIVPLNQPANNQGGINT